MLAKWEHMSEIIKRTESHLTVQYATGDGEHGISRCFFLYQSLLVVRPEICSSYLQGKKNAILRSHQVWNLNWKGAGGLTPVWGHFPLFLSTCVSLLPVFPHLPEVTDILALASLLPNSFLHYFLIHHVKVGKLMDPVSIPVFFVSCWPVYGLTALGLRRWGKKSGSI